MHTNEYASAIADAEQVIACAPFSISAYDTLGWLYLSKLHDFEHAIQTCERGLTANPANPILSATLGSLYARLGQTEKALEILEASAREHPGVVNAPSWLSYLYFRQNRLEEAAASCRIELEIKDAHSPHRVLGFIHHLWGRNDAAAAELQRAIELEPYDYEACALLAKIYRASGNLSGAEAQYNTGIAMAKEDEEAGLACFHAVHGASEAALTLLETACAKGQLSPGWLRIDPELYFIQAQPRFQALIEQEAQTL